MQLNATEVTKKILPYVFFLSFVVFAFAAYAQPGVDFRGYYGAALLVRKGGNPYDYAQLAPILEEISGFKGNNPYFYPPWYCLFFIPLTYLPFRTAQILWIFINLTFFYLSLEWTWQAIELKIPAWFRWMIFTIVSILFGYRSLLSENSGFVIFLGLALTLHGIKKDRIGLAGLGLAILLSKPQTAFIIVLVLSFWALKEKPKILLSMSAWIVALFAASLVIFPNWWNFDISRFGVGISYYQDGADTIVAKRAAATFYDWLTYFWHVDGWLFYTLSALCFFLGFQILQNTWRYLYDPVYILAASVLVNLLLTPYALYYDYVVLILPYFVILKSLPILSKKNMQISILFLLAATLTNFFILYEFQAYWIFLLIFSAYLPVLKTSLYTQKKTIEVSTE